MPADIVLLKTSVNDNTCYVETKSLDGETNLKIRLVNQDITDIVTTPQAVQTIQGDMTCEKPNASLYTFTGNLKLNTKTIPLRPEHLILRGMSLKNTESIHGLIIFAGDDTKLMQNSAPAIYKMSSLEIGTTKAIMGVFSA